jgi:hypothetical protein
MPTKIVGRVYWIEKGKQTGRIVDAAEAFGDPVQAEQQVLYAEASGDGKQRRLARLAFRQYQGKRYRAESKNMKTLKATGKRKLSIGKGKKIARRKGK